MPPTSSPARSRIGSRLREATPGRIVIAGLVAGFVVGKVEPAKKAASGGGVLQLMTALAGMFAGGSAQVAAGKAEDAAQSAEQVAEQAPPV